MSRAESDGAVGLGRLPTMVDTSVLPYLNAVVRELMRWEVRTRASHLILR